MAQTERVSKFVSQKIMKIRWQPKPKQDLHESNVFATGSWDDETNKISLWTMDPASNLMSEDDPMPYLEGEPSLLCDGDIAGDVTDLLFLAGDVLLAASSSGSVSLCKHHSNNTLSVTPVWDKLHHLPLSRCPCTGLSSKGDDTFVSVGEDGRLHQLSIERRQPIRTIEEADSCSINAVSFLKQSEVGTVNSTGQLKVWDLRQNSDDPAKVFLPTGDQIPLNCIDKHPTQPHIIATGGQDGALCIWDMRKERFPVTVLSAHSADMWEVRFHPSHPDSLLSCSQDGSAWHWDTTSINSPASINPGAFIAERDMSLSLTAPAPTKTGAHYSSAWLASEATKHRMEITDLLAGNVMPVNSLDIVGNTLLCATDGEQIIAVRNLVIR